MRSTTTGTRSARRRSGTRNYFTRPAGPASRRAAAGAQPLGGDAKDLVACLDAERVVDGLEIVEVAVDRGGVSRAPRKRQLAMNSMWLASKKSERSCLGGPGTTPVGFRWNDSSIYGSSHQRADIRRPHDALQRKPPAALPRRASHVLSY